jgi:hypothetical protein
VTLQHAPETHTFFGTLFRVPDSHTFWRNPALGCKSAGDGPFYLSARTAARLLAVDPSTAWRWLFLLEHDRILHVVTRGVRKERKASRFRYVAESKN